MKRLRDVDSVDWASAFEGACTWCRFYRPRFQEKGGTCHIDGEPTTHLSRCAAHSDRVLYHIDHVDINECAAHSDRVLYHIDHVDINEPLSAHEKAELLRVKLPTYERGLWFYQFIAIPKRS